MSHERLCGVCSHVLLESNILQMADRRGPNWDKWRRNMVLCAYPELLDVIGRAP